MVYLLAAAAGRTRIPNVVHRLLAKNDGCHDMSEECSGQRNEERGRGQGRPLGPR